MRRKKLFNVGISQTGSVNVMTSNKGGLTNEQIAELAIDKIVSVSNEAPTHIKQQANEFREHLKKLLYHYLLLARREERATIVHVLRSNGQKDLAEYIRRL
tara:strand:+ start:1575 stop:1877 length:303 start_codon:yes stop_codon:yes gene_type:complete